MAMKPTFYHFYRLDSTNTYLRQHALSLEVGTVVSAAFQTAGRGRGDNKWLSPPDGSALFSVLIEKTADWGIADSGKLSVRTAELVAEWLSAEHGIPVKIKPPNDLMTNGRKLGGILIEEVGGRMVIGIGINTNLSPESLDIDRQICSLRDFVETPIDNKRLIEELAEYLLRHLMPEAIS